ELPIPAGWGGEWFAALRFVARHHGVALSNQGARLAAQWDDAADAGERIRHMARRLGLRVAFSDPQGFEISTLHLPLIVETANGDVAIVSAISGSDVVIAPAITPAAERRIPAASF